MLPQNVLSTTPVPAAYLPPRNVLKLPLIDYEMGGIALQDASKGLRYQVWTGQILGDNIVLSAPSVLPATVFTQTDLTEFQFTFDQNMQPFLAYMIGGQICRFRWFDTTISQFVITTLPAGSYSPRCSLDDKRQNAGIITGNSDIILTYLRSGTLYFRQQRDRYTIEYTLHTGFNAHVLGQFGMNLVYRMQWQVIPVAIFPPVPTLLTISPTSALQGSTGFLLTLNGTFDSTTRARWNGTGRVTHYVSPIKLRMEVTTADLLVDGVANVSVFTPQPGGGTSADVPFAVVAQFQRLTEDGDTRITEAGDTRVLEEAP